MLMLVRACNAAVGVATQSDENEWGGDWSELCGSVFDSKWVVGM
jgi:hypothetical protein